MAVNTMNVFLLQHCKPAVDDECFQKLVDRQYEAMRRERLRLAEDPNNGKSPAKPDENELVSNAPTPNGATEAPVSEQEVSKPPATNAKQQCHYHLNR